MPDNAMQRDSRVSDNRLTRLEQEVERMQQSVGQAHTMAAGAKGLADTFAARLAALEAALFPPNQLTVDEAIRALDGRLCEVEAHLCNSPGDAPPVDAEELPVYTVREQETAFKAGYVEGHKEGRKAGLLEAIAATQEYAKGCVREKPCERCDLVKWIVSDIESMAQKTQKDAVTPSVTASDAHTAQDTKNDAGRISG